MGKIKKIIAIILCSAIILSMADVVLTQASTSVSEMEIYDMTVNDIINPIGIDTLPYFSWKLESDVIGQRQSAYRIVVKNGDSTVWDSGRVEGSDTVAIPYAGEKLTSSTEYSWALTVWDKDGAQNTSVAAFETGLLDDNAWDGTEWISVDGGADVYTNDDLHYTLETDVYITNHDNKNFNACIYFNKTDDYNYFMWQIKYTPADGLVKLRPHVKLGGGYSVPATADLTNYVNDIENIFNTPQSLKVDVTKSGVTTYFNGHKVLELASADLKIAVADVIGEFGIRAHGETTVVDSFKVTDLTTNVAVIDTDFSDGRGYFDGATVADGKATLIGTNVESLAPRAGFVPVKSFENADYTVETDITINTFSHETAGDITKFALAFNALDSKNLYMWQFSADVKNNKLTLTPHIRNLGSYIKPVGTID
ncbi:MAG: hypothetical protein IIX09_01050, partial [Clostridia bacterium]|nr:hypothetical protein [Clostridia bacterium]